MTDWTTRYALFLDQIEALEVDAALVQDPVHLRYLFNCVVSAGCALTVNGEATLIVDSRYIEQAREESVNSRVELASGSPTEALFRSLQSAFPAGSFRLAIEEEFVTHGFVSTLSSRFSRIELVPLSHPLQRLRQVKSPDEIDLIREAYSIAGLGYDKVFSPLQWAGTELQLAATLDYSCRLAGAERAAFETIVASGVHSSRPHARPRNVPLDPTRPLLVDFGVVVNGYCSDTTRVHLPEGVAEPDILKIVQEAQAIAIAGVKPGVRASEIDALARGHIASYGYGECFGHSLGHGIGLCVHERPRIHADSDTILQEGMVFTVEPGIYLPGKYGVRWEDAVIVTRGGCEVLRIHEREEPEVGVDTPPRSG